VQYGQLKQVSVLREADGSSKGCGFVLFDSREDAEKAIAALDKNLTLPGQLQPMEVRCSSEAQRGSWSGCWALGLQAASSEGGVES
jgi:RNA recognition motif-containing protein